jgi:hypothetical protein
MFVLLPEVTTIPTKPSAGGDSISASTGTQYVWFLDALVGKQRDDLVPGSIPGATRFSE